MFANHYSSEIGQTEPSRADGEVQTDKTRRQARVYSLCVDAEERLLPEECNAVFAPAADGSRELRQQRAETAKGVLADGVPWGWFEWVARALSPIRDASDDSELALPASARFLDVVGLEPPSPDAVATR